MNKLSFLLTLFACIQLSAQSGLVINEIMADNENTVTDQDGEYEDWIELYNNTSETINLAGYHLSDEVGDLDKWAFPDTAIAGQSYLIIWADKDEEQTGLHADFKLSKSGESLILSTPDTVIVDQLDFDEQNTDFTTGRYPNGTGDFTELNPTFSAQNMGPTPTVDLRANAFSLTVYPNPTSKFCTLKTTAEGTHYARVYTQAGQLILTEKMNKTLDIDCSDWEAGIYVVELAGAVQQLVVE